MFILTAESLELKNNYCIVNDSGEFDRAKCQVRLGSLNLPKLCYTFETCVSVP